MDKKRRIPKSGIGSQHSGEGEEEEEGHRPREGKEPVKGGLFFCGDDIDLTLVFGCLKNKQRGIWKIPYTMRLTTIPANRLKKPMFRDCDALGTDVVCGGELALLAKRIEVLVDILEGIGH